MDAVSRWAQDFPTLSHHVPEEDKRDAIRHAVETWLDMGDEEVSRQLAERVYPYNESSVELTAPVARPFGGRRARRHQSASANAAPMVLIPIGGGGGIHSQGI